jgi:anti-sigma regulatory factor (Ser/Thr protein kinase)
MAGASEVLRIAAESSALERVRAFVRSGGRAAGFSAERLDELDLVVEELFVNVTRYAYQEGGSGVVEFRYSLPAEGLLWVEIADQGRAYNPLTLADPDLSGSLAERSVGGLGVFLVRQFAQALSYRRDEGWNRLQFEMEAAARVAE